MAEILKLDTHRDREDHINHSLKGDNNHESNNTKDITNTTTPTSTTSTTTTISVDLNKSNLDTNTNLVSNLNGRTRSGTDNLPYIDGKVGMRENFDYLLLKCSGYFYFKVLIIRIYFISDG
jgi:hypothetical protein